MMFDFSVNSSNFKLFDTPAFGLAHLGRDGLHLNPAGKRLLTSSWVNCSLITMGLRQGPFLSIVNLETDLFLGNEIVLLTFVSQFRVFNCENEQGMNEQGTSRF